MQYKPVRPSQNAKLDHPSHHTSRNSIKPDTHHLVWWRFAVFIPTVWRCDKTIKYLYESVIFRYVCIYWAKHRCRCKILCLPSLSSPHISQHLMQSQFCFSSFPIRVDNPTQKPPITDRRVNPKKHLKTIKYTRDIKSTTKSTTRCFIPFLR